MAKKYVTDFSGGITDYPDKYPAKYQEVCQNLELQDDGSLETRSGSNIKYSTTTSADTNRIGHLFSFRDTIFDLRGNKLFQHTSTAPTELGAGNLNAVEKSTNSAITSDTWWVKYGSTSYAAGKYTLYPGSPSLSTPDVSDLDFTAGDLLFIKFSIENLSVGAAYVTITGSTHGDSSFQYHPGHTNVFTDQFLSTARSNTVDLTDGFLVSPTTNPNTYGFFIQVKTTDRLIVKFIRSGALAGDPHPNLLDCYIYKLDAPTRYNCFENSDYSDNHSSTIIDDHAIITNFTDSSKTADDDFVSGPLKIFVQSMSNHDLDDYTEESKFTATTLSPQIVREPTTLLASPTSSVTYTYALVPARYYTIKNRLYVDRGTPAYKTVTNASAIGSSNYVRINLGTVDIFYSTVRDHQEIRYLELYRTEGDGTTFYLIHSFANPTTTPLAQYFYDYVPDASITDRAVLYVTGGTLPYANIAPQKTTATFRNNLYFGFSVNEPRRITQFPSGTTYGSSLNAVTLPDEGFGLASSSAAIVAFTKDKCFRLDGSISDTGAGNIDLVELSSFIGSIGHSSVVSHNDLIFFMSEGGIAVTDGYSPPKIISGAISETYASITSTAAKRARIIGASDKINDRIYWSVQIDAGSVNDSILVLEPSSNSFRVYNGTSGHFIPSALHVYNSELYRASETGGHTFAHQTSLYTDRQYDTTSGIDTSKVDSTAAVPWEFKSASEFFDAIDYLKWVTRVAISYKMKTDIKCKLEMYTDGNTSAKTLKQINESKPGGYEPSKCDVRRTTAGKIRGRYKQIKLSPDTSPPASHRLNLQAITWTYRIKGERDKSDD